MHWVLVASLLVFIAPECRCFLPLLMPSHPFALSLPNRFPVAAKPSLGLRTNTNAKYSDTRTCLSVGGTKESETIEYDEVDLQKMKVAQLKDLCKALGLPVSGKKNDLIERLLEAAGTTQPSDADTTIPVSDAFPAPSSDYSPAAAQDLPAESLDSSPATGVLMDNTATTNDMLVEGRYRLFTQVYLIFAHISGLLDSYPPPGCPYKPSRRPGQPHLPSVSSNPTPCNPRRRRRRRPAGRPAPAAADRQLLARALLRRGGARRGRHRDRTPHGQVGRSL